jgi:pyruvate formate lyase activating enzyme
VLVPGLTDDIGEIEQVANFAAGLGNVERVDVLPFHQLGRFKWHQLGIPYTLENVSPPENESIERACLVFRAAGLQAH